MSHPLDLTNNRKLGFISALLLFLWGVQQGFRSGLNRPAGSRVHTSTRILGRRTTPGYVSIDTSYNITVLGDMTTSVRANFEFGADKQLLVLELSPTHETFVPLYPDSISNFCSQDINLIACQYAGTSGYYTPSNNSQGDPFTFYDPYTLIQELELNKSDYSAKGFWTEDKITAGGVSVSLQFGVAKSWTWGPTLGLGLWNIRNVDQAASRPNYLEALGQQGLIASPYCSFYDYTNPDRPGNLLIGALDKAKFSGNLTVFTGNPGVVPAPTARVLTDKDSDVIQIGADDQALIFPNLSLFVLPQAVLDLLLPLFSLSTETPDTASYYTPCDTNFEPNHALELTFDKFVVKIPLQHLVIPVPDPGVRNLCMLPLVPSGGEIFGSNFSYVLGAQFMRSVYMVVNPQEHITALALSNPNVTTTDIVPLGGLYGRDLSIIEGTAPKKQDSGKKIPVGTIAGGAVGGITVLAVLAALFLYIFKKRQASEMPSIPPADTGDQQLMMELESQHGKNKAPRAELDIHGNNKAPRAELDIHERDTRLIYSELSN